MFYFDLAKGFRNLSGIYVDYFTFNNSISIARRKYFTDTYDCLK